MKNIIHYLSIALLIFSIGCKSSKPTTTKKQAGSVPPIIETKNLLDPFAEKHIGNLLLNEVEKNYTIIYNPYLTSFINEVGSHVSTASTRRSVSYEFYIIDSKEILSIGLPGGMILVSTGLLEQIDTESELAGVLGVEIVNIEKQYLLRLLQKDGAEKELALSFDTNEKKRKEAYTFLVSNRFTDEQMSEADRLAMTYGQHFGYMPKDFNMLLKRLYKMQENDPEIRMKGKYNDSALGHRQSMGEIYVERLEPHQSKFGTSKDRYKMKKKYL